MAGILDGVNQHTQLAGQNRLEMLLFRLEGKQRYGINVFKVQEVIQCPPLTHLPNSHAVVKGVATMRGRTIPVMDLSMAIGMSPVKDFTKCFVIVTEYNRSVQGFLVWAVERIVNMNWEQILPPPKVSATGSYLTAVTKVDNELVEVIDVEKVLAEVTDAPIDVSSSLLEQKIIGLDTKNLILIADDSTVARNQIKRTLDQIGVDSILATNGREALNMLRGWRDTQPEMLNRLIMVISDIEMPEMDGYTLTKEIRKDAKLQKLHVLLHTSLSGVFNHALVEKVGADQFIPKFKPDELAQAVIKHIKDAKATKNVY